MRTENVYLIGPDTGPVKIGVAGNVALRLQALQTGNWQRLIVHHSVMVPAGISYQIERALHQEFGDRHVRGEWFDIDVVEASEILDATAKLAMLDRADADWFSVNTCMFLADEPAKVQRAVTRFRNGFQAGASDAISRKLMAKVGLASHVVFMQTIIERRDLTQTVKGLPHIARQAEASLIKAFNGLVEIYQDEAAAK